MLTVVGALLMVAAATLGAALIVRAAVHARRGGRVAVGADSPPSSGAGVGSQDLRRANVVGWRFSRLRSAGVDARLALRLAERPETDVHAVVALIRRGCPAPLAARITEPLPHGSSLHAPMVEMEQRWGQSPLQISPGLSGARDRDDL